MNDTSVKTLHRHIGSTKITTGDDRPVAGSAFRRSQYRPLEGAENMLVSPAVSEEDIARWRDRAKLLAVDKPIVARYLIEVLFGVRHHVHGLAYGSITLWERGAHFNGGGDSAVYMCPGKSKNINECSAIITESANKSIPVKGAEDVRFIMCPKCRVIWRSSELIGGSFYRLPLQQWANVVYSLFLRMAMDADIRVKYSYEDIRVAAEKEQNKELRGDVLERVRSPERRRARLYPLRNIIVDVNRGATLYNRLLSFLRD